MQINISKCHQTSVNKVNFRVRRPGLGLGFFTSCSVTWGSFLIPAGAAVAAAIDVTTTTSDSRSSYKWWSFCDYRHPGYQQPGLRRQSTCSSPKGMTVSYSGSCGRILQMSQTDSDRKFSCQAPQFHGPTAHFSTQTGCQVQGSEELGHTLKELTSKSPPWCLMHEPGHPFCSSPQISLWNLWARLQ